jgi:prephenate dehydrogenase
MIGARPLVIGAEEHDYLVAGISHLPLALAAALTLVVGEDPSRSELWRLAATGFRDVTRLASGNPLMGRDILLTNSDKVRLWLRRLKYRLEALEQLLDDGEALREELEKALDLRERWLEEKGWK